MPETQLQITLRVCAEGMQKAMEAWRQALHQTAVRMGMYDRLLATLPGDWPDRYVVLNRFLRTGRRPRWIAIPIDSAKRVR